MKKDFFKRFEQEYDDPEEQAQAEKEEWVFKKLMSCSLILIGVIAGIILLIFLYLLMNQ